MSESAVYDYQITEYSGHGVYQSIVSQSLINGQVITNMDDESVSSTSIRSFLNYLSILKKCYPYSIFTYRRL